ncbi:MAG: hypothetical protein WCP03_00550 [Candidatus Saccharibacteria bacterium]
MGKLNKYTNHSKDIEQCKHGHWNIHIARSLADGQPELENCLGYIEEHTSDFIRYKPMAELCVNLVLMGNVLPKIFGTNKFEKIPKQRVENFEDELNEIFRDNPDHSMPILDPNSPFSIHGSQNRYLSLQLGSDKDDSLNYDRKVITEHIVENYDVRNSFLRNNLIKLDTHIRLGTLAIDKLSPEAQDYMIRFPSDYIAWKIKKDSQSAEQYPGQQLQPVPIMPSHVSLNGLRAVCEDKDKWQLLHA